jgi:hypothetical protein
MSTTVNAAFVRQYEREVHLAYQRNGSQLRGTVRTQSGVTGESTTFQIIGAGVAGSKTRHGQVPVMNLVHTNVTATLIDRYAAEYIDKLDLLKLNIDERASITTSAARALGRATDQIIVDAMDDGSNSTTITVTTQAAIRNSMLEAREALATRDVDFGDGNIFGLLSPRMYSHMMTVPQFADADYVGSDLPFKDSGRRVHTWLGVHWQEFTGLTSSGGVRTGFIYDKRAVGLAIGADVTTMVDWVAEKAAWLADSMMSMGAVLIDSNGVQELALTEATALATS